MPTHLGPPPVVISALPHVTLADGLETPVLVLVGVLGLVIGSFLNVVIWRVPQKMSLSHPASHCPDCATPIRPRDNIPVVGWLLLRGRCRECQAPISVRYPLVEALTAALFVAVGAQVVHRPLLLPAYLFFTAMVVALAFIDLDTKKLPNVLTFPLAYVGVALLAIGAVLTDQPERLKPALVGAIAMYLWYAILYYVPKFILGRSGIGFGDVKLAPSIGLFLGYLGWKAWIIGLLGTVLVGGVLGVVLIAVGVGRKAKIPYGPMIIGGALVGLTLAKPLAAAWLGDAA